MSRVLAVCTLMLALTAVQAQEPKKEASLPDRLKAAGLYDKPFTMVVRIQIKPEAAEKFQEMAARCVAATNKEKGCVMYECNADSEAKGTYYFLEKWTNGAALESHMNESHTKELLAYVGTVVVGAPEIRFVTPVK